VADPYRWLENGDSPEVRAWTAEQDRYLRSVLDPLPDREAIETRLRALFSIGTIAPPTPRGGRYFYEKRAGGQEQPVLFFRDGLFGADHVLIDPAALSKDGTAALDWYYPSPDGRRLAYGVSEGGSEKSTLFLKDVDTGLAEPDLIPFTRACSLEWRPDSRGFFYTRYPEPGTVPEGQENYHRRVYAHTLGEDWKSDPLVFGADREAEDWPSVHASPDGRWLAISVSRGWTRTDVYLKDLARNGPFAVVVEGQEAVFGVTLRNDALYLHTNLDAPRFRLLATSPARPLRAHWREIVPEGDDVLEGVAVVGDRILAQRLREASSRLVVHDLEGRTLRSLELPTIGSVAGITGEWQGREAFFGFSSYTVPPAVYRVALPDGPVELWQGTRADLDQRAFVVRLVHYASRDGTRLSMFLVSHKDRPSPGGPALLTGYGGFAVSHTPAFGRGMLLFLEQGGLYAVAHLRGGGEYGEDGHRAGMLGHKQNVFDDFTAAAEFLVHEGQAARDRLAIIGGSNGGLLVGAALTQRPDLFRAVVCQVPLLDMLRYHYFRIARLWIPEYGSPDDPAAFRWLHAYSPYHRVRDGESYPAALLTTGEVDSRVDPMHARKMTARLQAATRSGRPVLLRVETRAGHGQGKPVSKLLAEWTDVWSFLFAELGLRLGPATAVTAEAPREPSGSISP
jgi:prolyl oligopeptidase